MSQLLKLALAVSLGVLAAAFNFMAVNSQAAPSTFEVAIVRSDLEPGQRLTADHLTRAQIPGAFLNAGHVLVRWEDRAMLLDRVLQRRLQTGEAILWRDVDPIEGKFDLGPSEVALQLPFRDVAFDPRDLKVGQPFGLMLGKGEGDGGDVSDVLGPFKLLRRPEARDGFITLAAARTPGGGWEPQVDRLLKGVRQGARITAVVYYRPGSEPAAGRAPQ